jgi:hypothetical protein
MVFFLETPAPGLTPKEVLDAVYHALTVIGGVCVGIGAVAAFFLTRYWNKRDRAADAKERVLAAQKAERDNQREILYDSLRWFEGHTQNRSIGIAVVNTSWNTFPEFQKLWAEVLVNQAIYLLTASKQGDKQHEHDNLRRIMDMLVRNKAILSSDSNTALRDTLDKKQKGQIDGGLTLTPTMKEQLPFWRKNLEAI